MSRTLPRPPENAMFLRLQMLRDFTALPQNHFGSFIKQKPENFPFSVVMVQPFYIVHHPNYERLW